MAAFEKFVYLHKQAAGDQQRLGQRFVNMFIRGPWPELFYERDDVKAGEMILSWLNDHQYEEDLPHYARTLPSIHK